MDDLIILNTDRELRTLIDKGAVIKYRDNLATLDYEGKFFALAKDVVRHQLRTVSSSNIISGGEVDIDSINNSDKESLIIKDSFITDIQKSEGNAAIKLAQESVLIDGLNITVSKDNPAYNIFEQPWGSDNKIRNFVAKNLDFDGVDLLHNIISIYSFEDGAKIDISDSKFKLGIESNVIRLDNLAKSKNVSIKLSNIDWTYPEGASQECLGLVLFQPSGTAPELKGDLSYLKTWKFEFTNCRYNGELITTNEFANPRCLLLGYNVSGDNIYKLIDDLNIIIN